MSLREFVHIHGNVNEPQSMILTDEDFGKAYITDGYVSRFLIKLFESYNILFIGYSYEDTIVKYLTRALTSYGNYKRFIMIGSESKEFELLGIQSICYGKDKYDILYQIVNHLGEINQRGLLDWQNTIKQFELIPPQDISLESEIEYCLHDENKTFILTKSIHGEKWYEWLDQRGVFDSFFNENSSLNEVDELWLDWFVSEFIGNNDNVIKRAILKNNNNINSKLVNKIINYLDNDKIEISDQNYCEYTVLLINKIHDGFTLFRLLETSYIKEIYQISFLLFKKMFDFNMELMYKSFSPNDEVVYECRFLGSSSYIDIAFDTVGMQLIEKFPIDFLLFVKDKINSIYNQYQLLRMASDDIDPLNGIFFSLERKHYYTVWRKFYFAFAIKFVKLLII